MSIHTSAFSVDVEDGINIAMRDHFRIEIPPTDRVISNCTRVVDLLNQKGIKATFFILGEVAKNFPQLVKMIHNSGHEIGAHGYSHTQFYKLTPDEVLREVRETKTILEEIIGVEVRGFRAPAFSISSSTHWALELIAESGYLYDSSIVPAFGGRYGWPGFPQDISRIKLPDNKQIIEVPLSVTKIFLRTIPIGGGGYFRLLPFWITNNRYKQICKKKPLVFYMHPYEIDTEKYPEFYLTQLALLPFKKQLQLRSYWINRYTVFNKLRTLIERFSFTSIGELVDNELVSNQIIETPISDYINP